jgi:hypothetical protein
MIKSVLAAAAVLAASSIAHAQSAHAQTARAQFGRVLMAADTPATVTAPIANAEVKPKLLHVYATADGESHLEVLEVAPTAGKLPLTGLRAISYKPNKVDWHHAPAPQFAINLTGDLQVEVSDGTKRKIGPGDLVFLEDTQGKGHITRLLGPVTALFIQPADGFDIRAWARGEQK